VADQAPIAVVLTPIRVEFDAVRQHLLDFRELVRVKGTMFYAGRLSRGPWQVVLARPGPGNITAAALAERAITHFRPDLMMLVGIAGRLHADLSLGDIVVGTKIYAIHSGEEGDTGFRPRPDTCKPDHKLVQEAMRIDTSDTWRNALPDPSRSAATKVEFRPIAAGEVVLNSKRSELARRLRHSYKDAAVIEMEGAGVGEACRLNKVPMLNIRAVSDHADGSKEKTDQAGGQEPAARNAAAFAMALLADVPPTRRATVERRPSRHVLVSGSTPAVPAHTDPSGWVAGGQVAVGDHTYLLVEETFAERALAGGAARQCEARGIRVSPKPQPGAEHGWLRRIEAVSNGVSARPELAMLAAERELLTELRLVRGLPSLVRFVSDE
jgi:nucleoside phosphorylase